GRVQGGHLRHARVACREADRAAPEGRGRHLVPRPARALLRGARPRDVVRAARAGRLRRGRDRHRPRWHRLRAARRRRAPRGRLPQRDRSRGSRVAQDLEAVTRVAHVGVGGWGKNLVRVVGELADLAWIVDTQEESRATFGARYPAARTTGSLGEAL